MELSPVHISLALEIVQSDYFSVIIVRYFSGVCFVDFYYSNMHSLASPQHPELSRFFSLILSRSTKYWKPKGANTLYIVLKNKRVILFLCLPCGFCFVASGKWLVLFQGCSFVGYSMNMFLWAYVTNALNVLHLLEFLRSFMH